MAIYQEDRDRISFLNEAAARAVRKDKCPTCMLQVACEGVKSAGGDWHADVHPPRGASSADMQRDANCLPAASA